MPEPGQCNFYEEVSVPTTQLFELCCPSAKGGRQKSCCKRDLRLIEKPLEQS